MMNLIKIMKNRSSKRLDTKHFLSLGILLTVVFGSSVMALETRVSTKYTRNCKDLGITAEQFKALPKRKVQANSELFVKRLTRAQELMGNEKFAEALEVLIPMQEKYKTKPYALAQVYQFTAYVYMYQSKYKEAIKFFEKSINLEVLPYRVDQKNIITVGRLNAAVENFKASEKYILRWLNHAVKPDSAAYEALANAYLQQNKFKEGICPLFLALKNWYPEEEKKQKSYEARVAKALEEEKPAPKPRKPQKPKKQWFRLLFTLHYQLKDLQGGINIMKAGLHHYIDEKVFWTQMGLVYAQLEDFQNSTAAYSLALRLDLLKTGGDYRTLASNYATINVPYKAAQIMELGLKKGAIESTKGNWDATAGNWQRAQELANAAKAYAKTAEIEGTGKYYILQGDVYLRMEKYNDAVVAYKMAIDKGKLKENDEGRAYLNMGITLTNSGKFRSALSALEKALRYTKQKRAAQQWIAYTKNKLDSQS
jgi:tetratricopeptide (TPR) repeat protein